MMIVLAFGAGVVILGAWALLDWAARAWDEPPAEDPQTSQSWGGNPW